MKGGVLVRCGCLAGGQCSRQAGARDSTELPRESDSGQAQHTLTVELCRRSNGSVGAQASKLDDAEVPPLPGGRFVGDTAAQGALANPGLNLHSLRHGFEQKSIDQSAQIQGRHCADLPACRARRERAGRWSPML